MKLVKNLTLGLAFSGLSLANATTAAEAIATSHPTFAANSQPASNDLYRPYKGGSPLDRRLALLTRELGLSLGQQSAIRQVLKRQRDSVEQVWRLASLSAADRVNRTQAIAENTADQIRAVLTDAQRDRYLKRRQREVAVGTAGANVDSWSLPVASQ